MNILGWYFLVFMCIYFFSLQMSVTLTYIFIPPKRMSFILFLYLRYTELSQ